MRCYFLVTAICTVIFFLGCSSPNTRTQTCSSSCTPPPPTAQFYAAGAGTVSSLSTAANGVPTLLGSGTGPSTPTGMVVDPSGKYLYISSYETWGYFHGFSIDSSTGDITPVANSPFSFGLQYPIGNVVADPSGQFLYTTGSYLGVLVLNIGLGGDLTYSGQQVSENSPDYGREVTIDPSGRFVYLTDQGGPLSPQDEISAWTLPGLVPVPNAPFVLSSNGPIVFGSGGKYLYLGTAENGDSNIWTFSIDPNTGGLTQIPGLSVTIGAAPYGLALATDPAGKFLFESLEGIGNTVSVFAIDANTGTLTPVPGSPFGTETTASALAVDPTGTFLYVPGGTNLGLSVFSIDTTTGALQPVPGSPFFSGQSFWTLAFRPVK